MHYDYYKDLEQSKIAVEVAKIYIDKRYTKGCTYSEIPIGNREAQLRGDLQVKIKYRKPFSVEVKYDVRSERTGNICFEIYNRWGRPSGILRTTAEFIYYVLKRKDKFVVLEFDADKLRSWLFNPHNYNKSRLSRGGDNNGYKLLLVKESYAREVANKIMEIPCAELQI